LLSVVLNEQIILIERRSPFISEGLRLQSAGIDGHRKPLHAVEGVPGVQIDAALHFLGQRRDLEKRNEFLNPNKEVGKWSPNRQPACFCDFTAKLCMLMRVLEESA
jgi:hypothetical protein